MKYVKRSREGGKISGVKRRISILFRKKKKIVLHINTGKKILNTSVVCVLFLLKMSNLPRAIGPNLDRIAFALHPQFSSPWE